MRPFRALCCRRLSRAMRPSLAWTWAKVSSLSHPRHSFRLIISKLGQIRQCRHLLVPVSSTHCQIIPQESQTSFSICTDQSRFKCNHSRATASTNLHSTKINFPLVASWESSSNFNSQLRSSFNSNRVKIRQSVAVQSLKAEANLADSSSFRFYRHLNGTRSHSHSQLLTSVADKISCDRIFRQTQASRVIHPPRNVGKGGVVRQTRRRRTTRKLRVLAS